MLESSNVSPHGTHFSQQQERLLYALGRVHVSQRSPNKAHMNVQLKYTLDRVWVEAPKTAGFNVLKDVLSRVRLTDDNNDDDNDDNGNNNAALSTYQLDSCVDVEHLGYFGEVKFDFNCTLFRVRKHETSRR